MALAEGECSLKNQAYRENSTRFVLPHNTKNRVPAEQQLSFCLFAECVWSLPAFDFSPLHKCFIFPKCQTLLLLACPLLGISDCQDLMPTLASRPLIFACGLFDITVVSTAQSLKRDLKMFYNHLPFHQLGNVEIKIRVSALSRRSCGNLSYMQKRNGTLCFNPFPCPS